MAWRRESEEGFNLCNEENFLASIRQTFNTSNDGRHYNDVEFSVSDGSKLGANKFLLASQSEYFHAMFYGSLKHEGTVALDWCSKKSLEKILGFLSVGNVDFTDLDLAELVELMDATRLMGLERLGDFANSTVWKLLWPASTPCLELTAGAADFCKEVLKALDVALEKQFECVILALVDYIVVSINEFIKLLKPEEIGVLSRNGMIALLDFDAPRKEIDLLLFFVEWRKSHRDTDINISQFVKLERLNAKELKIARKSDLFPVNDITNNFERIVMEHESSIKRKDLSIAEKDKILAKKEKILLSYKKSAMDKDELLQKKEKIIKMYRSSAAAAAIRK